MRIKSGVWYWLAMACFVVGLLYGIGVEGTAQTLGTVSDGAFITAMVLILLAVFFMRLGYKSANSFASAVSHGLSGSHRTYKYTFARERIDRSEVDSLPPVRTIRKKPAGAPTPTSCKG